MKTKDVKKVDEVAVKHKTIGDYINDDAWAACKVATNVNISYTVDGETYTRALVLKPSQKKVDLNNITRFMTSLLAKFGHLSEQCKVNDFASEYVDDAYREIASDVKYVAEHGETGRYTGFYKNNVSDANLLSVILTKKFYLIMNCIFEYIRTKRSGYEIDLNGKAIDDDPLDNITGAYLSLVDTSQKLAEGINDDNIYADTNSILSSDCPSASLFANRDTDTFLSDLDDFEHTDINFAADADFQMRSYKYMAAQMMSVSDEYSVTPNALFATVLYRCIKPSCSIKRYDFCAHVEYLLLCNSTDQSKADDIYKYMRCCSDTWILGYVMKFYMPYFCDYVKSTDKHNHLNVILKELYIKLCSNISNDVEHGQVKYVSPYAMTVAQNIETLYDIGVIGMTLERPKSLTEFISSMQFVSQSTNHK